MDPVADAVAILSNFLRQHDIRFMLVGGMANAVWGQVRATTDADLVLSLGEQHVADVSLPCSAHSSNP